jgi:hypothetical protein
MYMERETFQACIIRIIPEVVEKIWTWSAQRTDRIKERDLLYIEMPPDTMDLSELAGCDDLSNRTGKELCQKRGGGSRLHEIWMEGMER